MTTPDIVVIDDVRLCSAGGVVVVRDEGGAIISYRGFFYDACGKEHSAGLFDNAAAAKGAVVALYHQGLISEAEVAAAIAKLHRWQKTLSV